MKHNINHTHTVKKSLKLIFGIDDMAFATIAGGIGSSLIGGLIGSKGQSNANKANERINERNLQWQEDMWNKTNDYNTPQAQRERLLAAGINPLSAIGGVQNSQAQNLGAPQMLPMQNELAALGQGVADAGLKAAQIKNIEADTNLKNEEAGKTNAETATINGLREGQIKMQNVTITNIAKDTDVKVSQVKEIARNIQLMDDKAAEIGQSIELMMSQGALNDEQVEHLRRIDDMELTRILIEQGVAKAQIDNLHANSIAQIRNAAANLLSANAAQRQASAAERNAATNAAEAAAQIRLLNKEGEYYGTLSIGQQLQNGKLSIEYEVADSGKEAQLNYNKSKAKTAKVEPYLEVARDVVDIIGGLVSSVTRGKDSFDPAERRTFSNVNSNSTVTHQGSGRGRKRR